MRRICKNCVSFNRETCVCGKDGAEVDPESRPRLDGGLCFSQREVLTGEDLSKARSDAGKIGGNAPHFSRGRKKNPNRTKSVQIRVDKSDRDALVEYCKKSNLKICDLFHHFVEETVRINSNQKEGQ